MTSRRVLSFRSSLRGLAAFGWLVLAPACALEGQGGSGSSGSSSIFASMNGAPATFETATLEGTLGSGDLTVLMVVDRSGSMAGYWNGEPKWSTAQSALGKAIEGVEEVLTIGALLFPQLSNCEVVPLDHPDQIQFQRGDAFKKRWEVSNVTKPGGATPLGLAFRLADRAIGEAQESGLLKPRFRVVVVTDGEPSCGEDPEELVAMADGWRARGIEVQVMGLPGSQMAAELLHRIAGLDLADLPEGEEAPPPAQTWTPDAPDQGYVAPEDQQDVDDSLYQLVR